MAQKVVIIIPTYNEALIIEETVYQVFQSVQRLSHYEVSVLIFDSASQDNTQQIVRDLQSQYSHLHLQTEPQKSGLGSAYHAAMRYAMDELGADIVVEFDADLSHQPKYLVPMLESMEHNDVVVGSRYIKEGSIPKKWGWHRKLLSRLGSIMAQLILTSKYKDFTSGFRATRTTLLRKILPSRFISSDFAYKLELLWLLHINGAKIAEIPIDFIDRSKGKSKLAPNSVIDSMRVLLKLRLGRLAQYSCMCLVGLTGMIAQFLIYNTSKTRDQPIFCRTNRSDGCFNQ